MKQGYKTTEFWITILVQVVGILATTGVFTPEQSTVLQKAVPQIAGIVAMVAAAFGYSISRGVAKLPRKEKEFESRVRQGPETGPGRRYINDDTI